MNLRIILAVPNRILVFFMQLALSFDKLLEIENPVDASRANGYSSE